MTTPQAIYNPKSTFLGNVVVNTGKGVESVAGVVGMLPIVGGVGQAVIATPGVLISSGGHLINGDTHEATHNLVRGATEIGANTALDTVPLGGVANFTGRAFTEGWEAPTRVAAKKVADGIVGDSKHVASSDGKPGEAPLDTPVVGKAAKKPQVS